MDCPRIYHLPFSLACFCFLLCNTMALKEVLTNNKPDHISYCLPHFSFTPDTIITSLTFSSPWRPILLKKIIYSHSYLLSYLLQICLLASSSHSHSFIFIPTCTWTYYFLRLQFLYALCNLYPLPLLQFPLDLKRHHIFKYPKL